MRDSAPRRARDRGPRRGRRRRSGGQITIDSRRPPPRAIRGYGEAEGERDIATIDRDLEGAYRYLVGRKIRPIFLVGASMGGTAVLMVGGRVPVAGIATLSAPLALGGLDADPSLSAMHA